MCNTILHNLSSPYSSTFFNLNLLHINRAPTSSLNTSSSPYNIGLGLHQPFCLHRHSSPYNIGRLHQPLCLEKYSSPYNIGLGLHQTVCLEKYSSPYNIGRLHKPVCLEKHSSPYNIGCLHQPLCLEKYYSPYNISNFSLIVCNVNTAFFSDRRKRRNIPTRQKVSNFRSPRRNDTDSIGVKMAGIDHDIVGIFLASLLGFVLLFSLFRHARPKRKKEKDRRVDSDAGFSSEFGRSSGDGERGNGDDDVIIVGAGVAGAALAFTLGKDGRRVRVIERDLSEPDRIVGELLQPGGYLKLIELGLEDCVGSIDAQKVLGYGIFKDGKRVRLSYPLEQFHADVAGRSFHNGRFIQRMREKAATLPNVQLEQGTVTSLIEENGTVKGVQYKTKNGEELKVYAPLTVVCDGCFSNLRRSLCSPMIDVPSHFVGLVLTMENCELPFANHGHVILADPSPILFYPISSTEVRCLVDVPGKKLPSIANGEMAKYLKTVVAPQVPPEMYDAFVAAVDEGSIRTMPNRSMPATPQPTPGALLMGDAFNMRHPLTGGGMTVALSDIVLLRDLLRPLKDINDAPSLCKYLESFYTLRKPVASTINTLAGALYKVFCASSDEAHEEMRNACFDYLSLGGEFSNGPVALLSGLNPRPLTLVAHFFAVAVYGVGRLLLPFPSPKRVWMGARLLSGAAGIIFPIIKAEGVRQVFFPATVPAYYRARYVR